MREIFGCPVVEVENATPTTSIVFGDWHDFKGEVKVNIHFEGGNVTVSVENFDETFTLPRRWFNLLRTVFEQLPQEAE